MPRTKLRGLTRVLPGPATRYSLLSGSDARLSQKMLKNGNNRAEFRMTVIEI